MLQQRAMSDDFDAPRVLPESPIVLDDEDICQVVHGRSLKINPPSYQAPVKSGRERQFDRLLAFPASSQEASLLASVRRQERHAMTITAAQQRSSDLSRIIEAQKERDKRSHEKMKRSPFSLDLVSQAEFAMRRSIITHTRPPESIKDSQSKAATKPSAEKLEDVINRRRLNEEMKVLKAKVRVAKVELKVAAFARLKLHRFMSRGD